MQRQSSMLVQTSRSESKRHELSSPSRSRLLNDSTQVLCHGAPGSMKSELALLHQHQSCRGCATNRGPLSHRTWCGARRCMARRAKAATTPSALMARSSAIAGASRVTSFDDVEHLDATPKLLAESRLSVIWTTGVILPTLGGPTANPVVVVQLARQRRPRRDLGKHRDRARLHAVLLADADRGQTDRAEKRCYSSRAFKLAKWV